MRILYITYDGLTDPLGQSQVLPYLVGLAQIGHKITILSAEKNAQLVTRKDLIESTVRKYDIKWVPIKYHSSPSLLSTLYDIRQMRAKSKALHQNNKFDLIHCRSYIPSLIGLWLKRKYNVKFLFDMRGFWADERLEGGIWNSKNILFKFAYKYFKAKEAQFLSEADATITLTEKGKQEILKWTHVQINSKDIHVIPCCADFDLFSRANVKENEQNAIRNELGITKDDFILCYLGSLGTWYMVKEMAEFFQVLLEKKPNAKFLFITNGSNQELQLAFDGVQIAKDKLIIKNANRTEVPSLLSISHASIFFIKPVFSKIASSPTKLAEALGMGLPIICNSGIGDVNSIIEDSQSGLILEKFTHSHYTQLANDMDQLSSYDQNSIRIAAEARFSLDHGVQLYANVYQSLDQ